MYKIILSTILFVFLLLGCDKPLSNNDESIEENKTKEEALEALGVNINDGKITLDFNKTTEFFKKMEIEMHGRADEIERKIEHADINLTKGLGIDFKDNQLHIDLNQTKEMLQQINILMKDILLDVNNSIH